MVVVDLPMMELMLQYKWSTPTSLSKITQSGGGAALEVATGSVGLVLLVLH